MEKMLYLASINVMNKEEPLLLLSARCKGCQVTKVNMHNNLMTYEPGTYLHIGFVYASVYNEC